jgi:hypothetical protein
VAVLAAQTMPAVAAEAELFTMPTSQKYQELVIL